MQKQKKLIKNLFELRKIDKVIGYNINTQKSITFLYFDNKPIEMEKIISYATYGNVKHYCLFEK